ncbi:acyl-CoA thioesterase [Sphingomonas sp. GCM10030256]|uniref:acyl-CoA thioesterase n=1 Tax=Sphingomonas sp. GCM10030256 TaxID=3273427 RepID=UPI003618A5FD
MSRPPPARRSEFRVWQRFTTRWADNDAYGHVNNTVYYQWFDSAVNAWLVAQGLLEIARGERIALVVETGCTYNAPLSFPGMVDVGLAVTDLGRSSVRYVLGIFALDADVAAAQGHFVHVLVDRETRRPVPWPDNWRRALETVRASSQ